MSGHTRKIAAIAALIMLAVLCYISIASVSRRAVSTSGPTAGAYPSPSASEVRKSARVPDPAPEAKTWPQWGGAWNSAEFSGADFFNPSMARLFRTSIPAENQKYVVSTNSRAFLPLAVEDKNKAAADLFLPEQLKNPNQRLSVYMQFAEHPTDAQRTQLAQAGVELLTYVDSYAWTARGDLRALLDAASLPFVRGLAEIDPRDKLHAAVYLEQSPDYAMTSDGLTRFSVLTVPGTTQAELQNQLTGSKETEALTAAPIQASVLGPRFEVAARAHDAVAIAAASSVAFIELVTPPIKGRDATTDSSSNITLVRDQGDKLDGTGVTVAVREVGKPEAHVDFISRTTYVDSDGDSSNSSNYTHATSVVGQVASSGLNQPSAKGVAPNCKVLVYALSSAMDQFATTDITNAGSRGARVSNHSYGPLVSMWGDYQSVSADWDNAIQANNLVACFAGNEEGDSAVYKHIDFFVGMKNGLCIEATNSSAKAGNPNASPPVAPSGGSAFFAKYGPMNDGRVKPDLVAFGDGVTLDVGMSSVTSNTGTSFSTPAVTGIAVLAEQRYKTVYGGEPTAQLLKALLCESATDLGFPGPDAVYGFGIANADAAIRIIDLHQSSPSTIVFFEGSLTNSGTQSYLVTVPAGAGSIKSTLCWMDVGGNPMAAKALVNDLDMVLIDPNGMQHFPYSLDPANPMNAATNSGPNTVDPIEQTVVSNPIAGTWTIKVTGTSIPSGSQSYALCTNIPQSTGLNASASASPTSGFAPLTVSFSGTNSSGPVAIYTWTFGDGTVGTGATISHTYPAGTYTAFLTVVDALGNTSTSPGITITVTTSVLSASAVAAPVSGDAPLLVQFSGAGSGGNISMYSWNFGDGTTGTGIQTSHVYDIGTYNATLTVFDPQGNFSTQANPITITVTKPAPSDIYALSSVGRVNLDRKPSNQLTLTMIVPELVMTAQQSRDAIKFGTFEGKSYTVRAGVDGGALTNLYTFLVDRRASQLNRSESFRINFVKGTITTVFKNINTTRDLQALFQSFGITATTLGPKTFVMDGEIETDDVLYRAKFNMTFTGKNGKGTIKGGRN